MDLFTQEARVYGVALAGDAETLSDLGLAADEEHAVRIGAQFFALKTPASIPFLPGAVRKRHRMATATVSVRAPSAAQMRGLSQRGAWPTTWP